MNAATNTSAAFATTVVATSTGFKSTDNDNLTSYSSLKP